MALTETPITATLLKVNNTTVPGIKTYRVEYNHLWKDAERNMSGSVRASLIGLFPKIICETREAIDRTEVQAIFTAVESNPYFSVTFWDPATDTTKTADYYVGDWSVELESKNRGLYKQTKITLVPVDRRA